MVRLMMMLLRSENAKIVSGGRSAVLVRHACVIQVQLPLNTCMRTQSPSPRAGCATAAATPAQAPASGAWSAGAPSCTTPATTTGARGSAGDGSGGSKSSSMELAPSLARASSSSSDGAWMKPGTSHGGSTAWSARGACSTTGGGPTRRRGGLPGQSSLSSCDTT